MKNILILHTGGTIAMKEDKTSGSVGQVGNHPLHDSLASLHEFGNIKMEDVFNLPSPHITSKEMLILRDRIDRAANQEDIDGVVLTHGTDTLEETAYFLDLTLSTNIPVVLTGAMRSSNEVGSDGPYNLLSSLKVAASDEANGKGVLVVLNDEVHTAKNVTKTHTSNIATFQSPQYGPVGIVTKRGVSFHHVPINREQFNINEISKKVTLLKAYAGMDSSLLNVLKDMDIDGVIIEALGQGNLPPATLSGVKALLKKQIPIVLVSRCFNGIVQDTYSYEGGGRQLKELGVIFSNGLSGQKARIKLMIALNQTQEYKELQEIFFI
ncbi:L-asparaginase [Bacillus mesophilus]|uniref:asparaginase n=1 Tax=Bacillus mesophilus TaxID=1808955 RepID=A0A6M0Q4D8_9BACI|nr:asparaginase [Bacillus mesophilus]MBM7661220.1 L-asparaginase [Bacillus mesophilus]NEY71255.1 asparaginase [Bacillus mesophilus]